MRLSTYAVLAFATVVAILVSCAAGAVTVNSKRVAPKDDKVYIVSVIDGQGGSVEITILACGTMLVFSATPKELNSGRLVDDFIVNTVQQVCQ